MEHVVELEAVEKRLKRRPVLKGVELRVARGSLFGLIGLNGAGKTTTLRVALGLLAPDRGRVAVLGLPPSRLHTVAGRVGATLHGLGLEPGLTVLDNLRVYARTCGRSRPAIDPLLERLGLAHLRDRRVAKVSQGERQRVSLARALLSGPELLLLDEPLTHLDPGAVSNALDLLVEAVREQGVTVVLSSHQLDHVERAADQLALVHAGRVVLTGATEALLTGARTTLLLGAEPLAEVERVLRQDPRVEDVVRRTPPGGTTVQLRVTTRVPCPEQLNAALHAAGCRVGYLAPERRTLEDLFREAVGRPESAS